MPIDYERLMAYCPPVLEHHFTERDSILYALGVGVGYDPVNEAQLRFLYEKDLVALPTMACVLGYMRIADLDLGINYAKTLHGDQSTTLHKPLPVKGTVVSKLTVRDVIDRGDKGALIYLDREITDKANGDLLATVTMGIVARADGGIAAQPFVDADGEIQILRRFPQRIIGAVVQLPVIVGVGPHKP